MTVNGVVAQIGQSVDPTRDRITVDGTRDARAARRVEWIVLNKPAGVMTTRRTRRDGARCSTSCRDVPGLTYVGRLDYLTEGVLLLTTDGEAAHG